MTVDWYRTFTATAEVVNHFGARPVLCDSVPEGFNIDGNRPGGEPARGYSLCWFEDHAPMSVPLFGKDTTVVFRKVSDQAHPA